MVGVEVKADVAPKVGYAEEAHGFVKLMHESPVEAAILAFFVLLVLIMMPGGIGPAWVKYRGAKREEEKTRQPSVESAIDTLSKRAKRRQLGKQKGGQK